MFQHELIFSKNQCPQKQTSSTCTPENVSVASEHKDEVPQSQHDIPVHRLFDYSKLPMFDSSDDYGDKKVHAKILAAGQVFAAANAAQYEHPSRRSQVVVTTDPLAASAVDLLLSGFCHACSAPVVPDLVCLIAAYFRPRDAWHAKHHCSLTRNTERNEIVCADAESANRKCFAFGCVAFELHDTSQLVHEWTLRLRGTKKHPTRARHVCCGIGICHISRIDCWRDLKGGQLEHVLNTQQARKLITENVPSWRSNSLRSSRGAYWYRFDSEQLQAPAREQSGFVGFECLYCTAWTENVYPRGCPCSGCRGPNTPAVVLQPQGHCLNDQQLICDVGKAALTDYATCFMNNDRVTLRVDCKRKVMSVVAESGQRGKARQIEISKDIQHVERGQYKLAVWLRKPEQRIAMIESFVIGEYGCQ